MPRIPGPTQVPSGAVRRPSSPAPQGVDTSRAQRLGASAEALEFEAEATQTVADTLTGISDLAFQLLERKQKQDDDNFISQARSQFNKRTTEAFLQKREEGIDTNFARALDQRYDEIERDIVENAPETISKDAINTFNQSVTAKRGELFSRNAVLQDEAIRKQNVARIRQDVDDFSNLALISPELFEDHLEGAAVSITSAESLLGKEAADTLLAETSVEVRKNAILGFLRQDRVQDARSLLDPEELDSKTFLLMQDKIDQKRKQLETEQQREITKQINEIQPQIEAGRTADQITGADELLTLTRGTELGESLQFELDFNAEIQDTLRQPIQQQVQLAQEAQRALQGEQSPEEFARNSRLVKRVSKGIEQLQEQPFQHAASLGMIDEVPPMEFSDPGTILELGKERIVVAGQLSEQFGVNIPAFSDDELGEFTKGLIDAVKEDEKGAPFIVEQLRAVNQLQSPNLSQRVAEIAPSVGYAIDLIDVAPGVAEDLLIGQKLIDDEDARLPSITDRDVVFEEQVGGLFKENPLAQAALENAANALAAAKIARSPNLSERIDPYTEAIQQLTGAIKSQDGALRGGPITFNNQTIIPPMAGMTDDEFEDLFDTLTDDDLSRFGNGQPIVGDEDFSVDMFDAGAFGTDAQLVQADQGSYYVFFPGLGYVSTPEGDPFQLNLRDAFNAIDTNTQPENARRSSELSGALNL